MSEDASPPTAPQNDQNGRPVWMQLLTGLLMAAGVLIVLALLLQQL